MNRLSIESSARYGRWDLGLRGWQVHPQPVVLEPVFAPFPLYGRSGGRVADDTARPTTASRLFGSLWNRKPPPAEPDEDETPPAKSLIRGEIVELPLFLPPDFDVNGRDFEGFVSALSVCEEPVAFEIFGTPEYVTAQLAVGTEDEAHVRQQLRAFFPDIVTQPMCDKLEDAFVQAGGVPLVVDFALARDSLLPLASLHHDLCVSLIATLADLHPGEFASYQVLFQPVRSAWGDQLVRAVSDHAGRAFFINEPELVGAARSKASRPLFAVVVRGVARSPELSRTREILCRIAGALSAFSHPNGNELIPLKNSDYPHADHVMDFIRRETHRSGMMLNADEFFGFVRFPTSAVVTPKFWRQTKKTKAAPEITGGIGGLMLGINEHAGELREVCITPDQRVRHMHIIGASGTGKSTLLFNLIQQDIEAGEGVGVLDPHGDLIDHILGAIPEERIQDVVLIDPADEAYSIGFNILSAHSDWEKNLLASDLVSVFRRLSTSWGDQMDRVLANAILAFLESDRGGTLMELRRFLVEPAYREKFLATVRDSEIVYYWRKGFSQLTGNKSIGPVLTRLETFLAPKPIRYMVAQPVNRLDFGDILDSGKIFLAKLSQGALGKENSHLLGSLFVAKFQQLAMSRQRQAAAARRDFWLYLDEFQDFMTPSMAEMLAGTRKYRLGLALAHQEMRQMQRDADVAGAVSNAYTRIFFRVGDQDARTLANGLSSFEARDLQNLGTSEAICRVERSDYDFNLAVVAPNRPTDDVAALRRWQVVCHSRERYATPRAEVEAALRQEMEREDASHPPKERGQPKAAPRSRVSPPEEAVRVPPGEQDVFVPPPPVSEVSPPRPPLREEPVTKLVTVAPVNEPPTPFVPPPLVTHVVNDRAPSKRRTLEMISEWGRGGPLHRAVVRRITVATQRWGFRAESEGPAPGVRGNVDLVLVRENTRIACEITVTNKINYEFGNVVKCLKGGYELVAVIGLSSEKITQLESAVRQRLGPELANRVNFFLPDAFLAHVQALPPPKPPGANVRERRGYRVKRSFPQLSEEEAKTREDATIDAMVGLMRKKAKRPREDQK